MATMDAMTLTIFDGISWTHLLQAGARRVNPASRVMIRTVMRAVYGVRARTQVHSCRPRL